MQRLRALSCIHTAVVAAVAAAGLPENAASQDAVAAFYKDKQIRFVIRQAPGGSYDVYSRLIGRHITKYIPGNPIVVPNNMPGAGGLTAVNYVAQIASKDGTFLVMPALGIAMYQALGHFGDKLKGDMGAFQWVGNVTSSNPVLITWHSSKVKTLDDARKFEAILGTSGAGSISAQLPALYNNILGTRLKVLYGYTQDDSLAMERGEIDGRAGGTWAGYKAVNPDWVRNNRLNVVLQLGLKKEDDLPNVPLVRDLAQNEEQKQILEFFSKVAALTRPISTTDGVPKERVAALRKAFMDTMHDPAFTAEGKRQSMDLGPFMDGEEVQRLTLDILNTPKPLLDKVNKAIQHKAGDEITVEPKAKGEKSKGE